jgi:hypothetical protein
MSRNSFSSIHYRHHNHLPLALIIQPISITRALQPKLPPGILAWQRPPRDSTTTSKAKEQVRHAILGGNLHRYVFGETPLLGRILSIPLYVVHYLMWPLLRLFINFPGKRSESTPGINYPHSHSESLPKPSAIQASLQAGHPQNNVKFSEVAPRNIRRPLPINKVTGYKINRRCRRLGC